MDYDGFVRTTYKLAAIIEHSTMKRTFTILILIYSMACFSQIKINVIKISTDSISIIFPYDMKIEVGKEYTFEYQTNVKVSDNLKEGLSEQILYDGLIVKKSFDHYEYGINITSKNKNINKNTYDVGDNMFYISGTEKWKIKLDGKYLSRNVPNDIHKNSKIEIELQSDNFDLSKAKYDEPIILYWMRNQQVFKKINFNGTKISIDLNDFEEFMKGYNYDEKFNHIVILLPQVKVENKKLFSDEQKKRVYILRFVKV